MSSTPCCSSWKNLQLPIKNDYPTICRCPIETTMEVEVGWNLQSWYQEESSASHSNLQTWQRFQLAQIWSSGRPGCLEPQFGCLAMGSRSMENCKRGEFGFSAKMTRWSKESCAFDSLLNFADRCGLKRWFRGPEISLVCAILLGDFGTRPESFRSLIKAKAETGKNMQTSVHKGKCRSRINISCVSETLYAFSVCSLLRPQLLIIRLKKKVV